MEDMQARIDKLTEAMEHMQVTVLRSLAASSAAAPSAASSAPSWLEPRPLTEEMERVVRPPPPRAPVSATAMGMTGGATGGAVERAEVPPHPGTFTGSRKAPDQPIFRGTDYRGFLTRYQRWAMLSGVDQASDDVKRTWFMAALGDECMVLAEALYANTHTFDELVFGLGKVYPSYTNDYTLRHDMQALPPLGDSPSLADVESLVVTLEGIWARMTPGAFSDQERMVTLINKVHGTTWRKLREHPTHKTHIGCYDEFKSALRAMVNEQQSNDQMEKLRGMPLLALNEKGHANERSTPPAGGRGRPEQPEARFSTSISCKFCGRRGHYESTCYFKHPQLRPPPRDTSKGDTSGKGAGKSKAGGGKGKGKGKAITSSSQPPHRPDEDKAPPRLKEDTQMREDKAGGTKRLRSEVMTVLYTQPNQPVSLLKVHGMLWNTPTDFVVDSGAALEGCLSEKMVPPSQAIDREARSIVKVGDGRSVWTVGTVGAKVDFGGVSLRVTFTILPTTAFKALLGLRFLLRQEVSALTFRPPSLTIKDKIVPLDYMGSTQNMLQSLIASKGAQPESYRLLGCVRSAALAELAVQPFIDLFANPANKEEALYCTVERSAWRYDWAKLYQEKGVLWANPPFSKVHTTLVKCAIEPCRMLIVTPDWPTSTWNNLLDRLTVRRTTLHPQHGVLYWMTTGTRYLHPHGPVTSHFSTPHSFISHHTTLMLCKSSTWKSAASTWVSAPSWTSARSAMSMRTCLR